MTSIKLRLSEIEIYEAGAALLTLLAYPEPTRTEQDLGEVQASLCSLYLSARAASDPEWANAPQRLKPLYAFRSEKQVHRDWKPLPRRWRDRMVAARMAIAFLKERVKGEHFQLPGGLQRLTVHQLAEFVVADANQSDYKNVETRVWRPSIPVIHLAAAVAVAIDQIEKASSSAAGSSGRPVHLAYFLSSRDTLEWVVKSAEEYAEMLAEAPVRGISTERLIRISLV